ncbi:MAG: primosomal protein N' [Planctomycetales bacterium]|nr:primosomal protein N' [Planctomycetales bacterium]NIM09250.1 primosomal protein N' [Planctomycetales bacterium]NIN08720.1 primosomal protein N' [Planctomycetales bacterium]NIN77836.1 primosomal protein N' [Planctomycetales bacterium]NIO35015.1 primosomal protein N' [Planctomycetales bacterium]
MKAEQKSLFDTDAPPWQLDAAAEQYVAQVAVAAGPVGVLDYVVPEAMRDEVQIGTRVRVPLGRGNRRVTGYCVGLQNVCGTTRRLKNILQVVDGRRLLSPAMLRLTKWMSDYYLCPLGQVLETVVPAGVRGSAGTRQTTILSVPPAVRAGLRDLKLPKKQAAVLEILSRQGTPMTPAQLAEAAGCTTAPISALRRKGLIASQVQRLRHQPLETADQPVEPYRELNDQQHVALQHILKVLRGGRHETILMQGVTGSGKTEVYMHAIREVVSYGRQAIVLVPEISLTPQTVSRFRKRFGAVAVLHSHLSDVQRHGHWEQIASGTVPVPVIVGARSAVFAPTPHLGLIVIDEEHENSFKQETAPRYHAREVARQRAIDEQIPLVLGSATPSLESYYRAERGEYLRVRLPHRVENRPLPAVNTIDLRTADAERYSRGAISRQLHIAIEQALSDGGQVILLLNRRGFSTHIQCPSCGKPVTCPQCEIGLTHHKHQRQAICHYCDYRTRVPDRCPHCNFSGVRFLGKGTQKLEEEVASRFPNYQCLRMDTDSMQRPGSHEGALARFRQGEVQILLGTQMIAKGLDFPNVTLVGVINADSALHLPDFRAEERTFQLLTQVAGRTGRGPRGGHVVVQTLQPEHPAIQAAVAHDYEAFAAHELPTRKLLGYPPYGAMIRIVVRSSQADHGIALAGQLAEQLQLSADEQRVALRRIGPAPAPFAKLRGKHRFALQLLGREPDGLRSVVRQATKGLKTPGDAQWIVDVDPLDML